MASTRYSLRLSQALQRVIDFNAKHPVGSNVRFRRADGTTVPASIRSTAEVTRRGETVVWLNGIAGPKSIDRIEEMK